MWTEVSVWTFATCFLCLSFSTCLASHTQQLAAGPSTPRKPRSLLSHWRDSPTSPHHGHILFRSWRKGSSFLWPLTNFPPVFSPLLLLPLLTVLQPLVFLLFFKHTQHVPTPGFCTGCTLTEKVFLQKATGLLLTPVSSLCYNLTFSVHLTQQLCLKQQPCPLYILLRPLSCFMIFIVPSPHCLIICFNIVFIMSNWLSGFPQHFFTLENLWGQAVKSFCFVWNYIPMSRKVPGMCYLLNKYLLIHKMNAWIIYYTKSRKVF